MKLRLEAFEGLSVLVVSDFMDRNEARVLLAGIDHLKSLKRPWILIDLERAQPDREALQLLETSNETPSGPIQTRWVGRFEPLCQFLDLESALDQLKFKEFRELGKKIELQMQKESLSNLICSRQKVSELIESQNRKISEIETEYFTLNQNLRAAQTLLINQILDPVFVDLIDETKPSTHDLLILFKTTNTAAPPVVAEVRSPPPSPSSTLYEPKDLRTIIQDLSKEITELRKLSSKPFIEGADRAVSLVLENDFIKVRIQEVREVWLQQLKCDFQVTESDVKNGFEPFLVSLDTKDPEQNKKPPLKKAA